MATYAIFEPGPGDPDPPGWQLWHFESFEDYELAIAVLAQHSDGGRLIEVYTDERRVLLRRPRPDFSFVRRATRGKSKDGSDTIFV